MNHQLSNFFRAATRPIVTIIFAAVIAQVITEGIDIPWEQWTLLAGVILWWFGDRTREHINKKKGGKDNA